MSNRDGLDERGRTRTEAGIDNAAEAICERLDRLVELAEQAAAERTETMRALRKDVDDTLASQAALLRGLSAGIHDDKAQERVRRADEKERVDAAAVRRIARVEGRLEHIEEVLANARLS